MTTMENNSEHIIQEIKMPELVEFFASVGVSPKCTACEDGVFGINIIPPAENPDKIARLWVANSVEIMPDGTLRATGHLYPTIYTICGNCGYVRHFSPSKVTSWLKDKKDKAGGAGE